MRGFERTVYRRTTYRAKCVAARLLSASLALFVGCADGPELANVTGKVTYNGKPVIGATIYFIPLDDGKQSIGYTDDDGQYELQYTLQRSGALIGRHRISIQIFPRKGIEPVPVPAKYGGSSEVQVDVVSGSNRFDIELAS